MDFEKLWIDARPKVYNLAYKLTMNRSDAEDLTSDTMARALTSFSKYQGDRAFTNWVLRIATRLFLDRLRMANRRVQTTSYDAYLDGTGLELLAGYDADPLEAHGIETTIRAMVAAAPLPKSGVVIRLLAKGCDYAEISAELNIPVGTVRSKIHRIRRRLELAGFG